MTTAAASGAAPVKSTPTGGGQRTDGSADLVELDAAQRVRRRGGRHEVRLRVRSLDQHGRRPAGGRQGATHRRVSTALDSVHQFQVIFFNHEMRRAGPDGRAAPRAVRHATRTRSWRARFIDRRDRRRRHGAADAADASAGHERPTRCSSSPTPTTPCRATTSTEAVRRAQRSSTAIACIEFGEGPSPRAGELSLATGPRHGRAVRVRRRAARRS